MGAPGAVAGGKGVAGAGVVVPGIPAPGVTTPGVPTPGVTTPGVLAPDGWAGTWITVSRSTPPLSTLPLTLLGEAIWRRQSSRWVAGKLLQRAVALASKLADWLLSNRLRAASSRAAPASRRQVARSW